MSLPEPMTAEQFVAQRDELPDGGRWTELIEGRPVTLEPPTLEHGTAIFNLTKALSEFVQREPDRGYACFELGLVLARGPDTVLVPALSFFSEGLRFAESDKVATESRPALVAEVTSTNDRRRGMEQRVARWLDWGVRQVWVLDPQERQAHAFEQNRAGQHFSQHQTLRGGTVLGAFRIDVGELFQEPAWYRSTSR